MNNVRRFKYQIIKVAYEKHREWFDATIRDCISNESSKFNVSMLKYLREHGCPWGSQVPFALTMLKQTALLEYIQEDLKYVEGIPGREYILIHAIQEKWFEGIRYILENNLECIVPPLNLVAFDFPRFDVLQYCKKRFTMGNSGRRDELQTSFGESCTT